MLGEWTQSYKYTQLTPAIAELSKVLLGDKTSVSDRFLAIRQWLNGWVFDERKQPINKPANLLESRLISAQAIYDSHMSSCGAMVTLGATILRASGVAVKLIDGAHPKSTNHAWMELYDTDKVGWAAYDVTGYGNPDTGQIDDAYTKHAECHDWSEIEPALQAKYQQWRAENT